MEFWFSAFCLFLIFVVVVVGVVVLVVVGVVVVFVVVANVKIRCLCWLRLSTREACGRGARLVVAKKGASRPRGTQNAHIERKIDFLSMQILCVRPMSSFLTTTMTAVDVVVDVVVDVIINVDVDVVSL